MIKYEYLLKLAATIICALSLTACDQQKQSSAEVGAILKQILDLTTNDINAAQALAAEKMKAVENVAEK